MILKHYVIERIIIMENEKVIRITGPNVWDALVESMSYMTDETEVIEQLKTDIKAFREYTDQYTFLSSNPGTILDLFIHQYRYTLQAFHHGCYDKYSKIFDDWLDITDTVMYSVQAPPHIEKGENNGN